MIGRKKEIAELEELYAGKRAQLVAVYGRRRVGKTHLIEQTFRSRFAFRHAGLSPADNDKQGILKAQLSHFYQSLKSFGLVGEGCPSTWLDAFYLLQRLLEEKDQGTRQVVFLDELPWMDTPRSGFIRAFEGFWNNWGAHRENLMVIVCGSANAWMLDKLINNHGGLYGRVTYEIKLSPFTLGECEEFLKESGVMISRYDIAQSHMIVGGIPFYLQYFKKGLSLVQNIDALFFEKDAKLRFEYDRLFSSVFSHPVPVRAVVEFLATKNAGYTRKEIVEKLGIHDGGTITNSLNALLASDFIVKYVPFGMSGKQEHYKLTDSFCLFYLRFVRDRQGTDEDFWTHNVKSQQIVSWRGIAFENLCFQHIRQIKSALGISGVSSRQSAWSKRGDDREGTQIDLLIDRNDNVLNMCEIKFYGDEFVVDKAYYYTMMHRQELLSNEVSKKTAIHSTLITTFGLTYNEYSGIFSKVITLEDLFI
ncbi:MAG: AAA family ATPase [Lachnospiraceae bacterium]|nr:AAA family ATPase [Lachnospiraceae bacterium]